MNWEWRSQWVEFVEEVGKMESAGKNGHVCERLVSEWYVGSGWRIVWFQISNWLGLV